MTGLSLDDTERELSEGMNQQGGKKAPSPSPITVYGVWFGAPGTMRDSDQLPEIDDANTKLILRVRLLDLSVSLEKTDEGLKKVPSSSGGSTSERDLRGCLRVFKFSLLDSLGNKNL